MINKVILDYIKNSYNNIKLEIFNIKNLKINKNDEKYIPTINKILLNIIDNCDTIYYNLKRLNLIDPFIEYTDHNGQVTFAGEEGNKFYEKVKTYFSRLCFLQVKLCMKIASFFVLVVFHLQMYFCAFLY